MFKFLTTDFRMRSALIVAAGLMSLSGFTNHGDVMKAQEKSSMASEAPQIPPAQHESPQALGNKASAVEAPEKASAVSAAR